MMNTDVAREKINLEYQLFEVEDAKSVEDVTKLLSSCITGCEMMFNRSTMMKTKNNYDRVISWCLGRKREKYDLLLPREYKEDNELLDLHIALAMQYQAYFQKLGENVTDNNKQDIYHLARFASFKYGYNDACVSQSRMIKRSQSLGLFAVVQDMQMDNAGFDDFFLEEFKRISCTDEIQFRKK